MKFNSQFAIRNPQFKRRCLTLALLILLGGLAPVRAAQAVLQPGEKAPSFSLKDTTGRPHALDAQSSGTALLVFVKPPDRYLADELKALDHMFTSQPVLAQGVRRWVVVSRLDDPADARKVAQIAGDKWTVLPDEKDALYHGYKIIATPTVVIATGGRVAAVHPGFDPGMEDNVRQSLARALSVKLPDAVTGQVAKPNMDLQMGRRLAARGLWDRALEYYQKAEKHGPLPAIAQVEIVEIYIEMEKPDVALALLAKITAGLPAGSAEAGRAAKAAQRAQALKEGRPAQARPPKVIR